LICFRITKVNRDEVLSKAENDLAAVVNQYIAKLVKELQGTDFWKLRRAYTFGVSTNLTLLHLFINCRIKCTAGPSMMHIQVPKLTNGVV